MATGSDSRVTAPQQDQAVKRERVMTWNFSFKHLKNPTRHGPREGKFPGKNHTLQGSSLQLYSHLEFPVAPQGPPSTA